MNALALAQEASALTNSAARHLAQNLGVSARAGTLVFDAITLDDLRRYQAARRAEAAAWEAVRVGATLPIVAAGQGRTVGEVVDSVSAATISAFGIVAIVLGGLLS